MTALLTKIINNLMRCSTQPRAALVGQLSITTRHAKYIILPQGAIWSTSDEPSTGHAEAKELISQACVLKHKHHVCTNY